MDFTKFVSLIVNRGLYLARSDFLGDPFEGALPALNVSGRREFYDSIYGMETLPKKSFEDFDRDFRRGNFLTRQTMYVNCWHMNEIESAGMWSQYTNSNEAIAIQSTYSRLYEFCDSECHIGAVNYIDYDRARIPEGNVFWPFLNKRMSFSHERELRVVKWKSVTIDKVWYPNPEKFYWMNVDLRSLIQAVYVSPSSADWYADLVKTVLKALDCEIEVRKSELGKVPLF